jgi:two-component system, sensor histidine kinase and response regulator
MVKILVIEDDDAVRDNILELLAAEGFTPFGAENGTRGLKLARELLPDLILCDIVMPGIDGFGVLAVLNQEKGDHSIPFIFLTARVARDDARKGMELGADDYLTKPFTRQELLNAITTRLAKQKSLVAEVSQRFNDHRQDLALGFPHRIIAPLSLILQSSDAIAEEAQMLHLAQIKAKADAINRSARNLSHTIQNLLLLVELDPLSLQHQEYELSLSDSTPASHRIIEETIVEAARSHDRLADIECSLQEAVLRLPEIHLQRIIEEVMDILFIRTARSRRIKILGKIRLPCQSYTLSFFVAGEGMPPESVAYFNSLVYKPGFLPEYMEPSLDWFVAKRLVELYHGNLVIESTLGIGATLLATLPLNVML